MLTASGLAVAAALLLVFLLVNLAGVRWLARANTAITAWKLVIPVVASIALIIVGFNSANFTAFGFAPMGADGVFAAVSAGGVMFSLFGFRTAIDMAGQAENPQVSVPLAIIGAVVVSLAIYLMLQAAFIGVVPQAHLARGWANVSENVPGGPFAAFATILGMQWLAAALYFDAVLSPSGTAIAYIGATARINYALAQNGQFPSLFLHLNRESVPVWALLFNFVLGFLLFLPFPGWAELVGFISSAAVLSLAFGPVSMAALRHQLPDEGRPFRLRAGMTLSTISFVLVGCVVYWSGWDTNWKVFALAFAGALLLCLLHWKRGDFANLNLTEAAWFGLFVAGLAAISYLGNYGNGLKLLRHGSDLALVALLSLGVFWLALRTRLPAAKTKALIAATLPEFD